MKKENKTTVYVDIDQTTLEKLLYIAKQNNLTLEEEIELAILEDYRKKTACK